MKSLTDIAKKVKSVKTSEDIDFIILQLQAIKKSMSSEVEPPNTELMKLLERGATMEQIQQLGLPNLLEELEKIRHIKIHDRGMTRYLLK